MAACNMCTGLIPYIKGTLKCLREEFSLSNLGFQHEWPRWLLEPQWRGRSLAYVVYRVAVALYFLTVIVYDGVSYQYGYKWFIYLTDWFYVTLTLHVLILAFAVTFHYERLKRADPEDPIYRRWWPLQIIWFLQNVCMSGALLIAFVYWGWTLNEEVDPNIDLPNVTAHVLIAIYVLGDSFITGIPMRLLHVYQPPLLGLVYSIFTWIYWAFGGTNPEGKHYIYSVMDYTYKAKDAAGKTMMLFLFSMFLHMVMFGIYRVRILLYGLACCATVCCCMSKAKPDTSAIEVQIQAGDEQQDVEEEVVQDIKLPVGVECLDAEFGTEMTVFSGGPLEFIDEDKKDPGEQSVLLVEGTTKSDFDV